MNLAAGNRRASYTEVHWHQLFCTLQQLVDIWSQTVMKKTEDM